MKSATKFIHAGVHPDPSTGAIMTPIFQTSTFVQDGPGKHKGYEYARTQNPTRTQLQNALAASENGRYGISFGSGLAATDTLLKLFKPGDEIISTNDLYGGTYYGSLILKPVRLLQKKQAPCWQWIILSRHLTCKTRSIWERIW